MSALAEEFQDVFQLYLKLSEELTKIIDADDSKDPLELVDSILKNRDCLNRIENMNFRVLRLSEDWEKYRSRLGPESPDEVRDLAGSAKAQAIKLRELCNLYEQKIRAIRDKLGENLEEVGKGSQYLKSVKPIKYNYPKFIDSLY
jgi:uncharacterized coiled-coil DUF342 family protein